MSESKNNLTIEQLKLGREIGAKYCRFFEGRWNVDYYKNICIESGEYEFWSYYSSRWVSMNGLPIDWSSGKVFRINFTPLDDYYAGKDADIRAQNAAAIEAAEQPLKWPVGEELIGRKVRFFGYTNVLATERWCYKQGSDYVIAKDCKGSIGPLHDGNIAPNDNYGFLFFLLHEEKQEWPEERQDVVGQNGNDGEHYDNVKNPSHYQLLPGVEVIDVRMAILSNMPASVTRAEADHWSRAWEYLTRMWGKNGLEDAKKARVYLDWLIDEMEGSN